MNQTDLAILQAIKESLWKSGTELPVDTDWDALLEEAQKQTVLGIIAVAVPLEVQKQWKTKTNAIIVQFIRILYAQKDLLQLLQTNNIPAVILKGTASAIYYPNPMQRSMGDIDYMVPIDQFDRAKDLLIQNGYTVYDDPRKPRHAKIEKNGVLFEQHRFFSRESLDIEQFILDGFSKLEVHSIDGIAFPMLPDLANGLVLLAHLVGHLHSGLGLRQVVDWMMYVDRVLDDMFWEKQFRQAAEKTGLVTMAKTATRMCQLYLGLSERITWCKDADPGLCSNFIENLLSSGNFDRKRGNGRKIETITTRMRRKGVFRYLQTAGEFNWNAYHKHPCLKPFAWLYQIGRYAKQRISLKRTNSQIVEDVERGRKRSALIERLRIGKTEKE